METTTTFHRGEAVRVTTRRVINGILTTTAVITGTVYAHHPRRMVEIITTTGHKVAFTPERVERI